MFGNDPELSISNHAYAYSKIKLFSTFTYNSHTYPPSTEELIKFTGYNNSKFMTEDY
jgi:hypothetical protein